MIQAPLAVLPLAASGGFNPLDPSGGGLALWTWIIFLIALPPIWKVVMGPITRALEERDERAAQAIEAAERASREAEKARAEVEVKLGEAQAQAAKLLTEARERAEEREREMVEQARREAQAMIDRARADIEAEREKALLAIRDEVVDLSLEAASRVLRKRVDSAEDRRLVEELVSTAAGRGPGA